MKSRVFREVDTTYVHRSPGEEVPVILPVTHCLIYRCKEPIKEDGYCTGHLGERKGARNWGGRRHPVVECGEPGCGKRAHARGLCRKHYNAANYARRKDGYNAARREKYANA